ncbi:MAG: thermopsin family protease [Thermoplasmata archaeon]|nr:thermopsin family protease [Thermoplasmata archaeon]
MSARTSRVVRSSLVVAVGLVALLLLPASAIPASGHGALPPRASAPIVISSEREPSTSGPPEPSARVGHSTATSPDASGESQTVTGQPPLPPQTSIVNPLQYYSREPAPMGIADFGVTGASPGASGYEYSSPSFQGQAVVRSLAVTISGTSSKVTAFELNAVVVLQRNGTDYSYWVQNGLHLDAGSDEFTIGGAYVWNFSSPGATLSAGELNGSAGSMLASDTYYYIPGCGVNYSGQCTTLGLPATITGRILTSTSAGVPFVAYQYDLGSGWVTYDNVSFPRMTAASDSGFRVDGFAPTPYAARLYYDAEWVWVGAGGGSASTDQGSDLNMTLSWWNGHNYQAVPTAWNFGGDTGETSSNVTDVAANPLGAHLASGAGTLGVLYNLSGVGFLNLSVPTRAPASVLVDGHATPFQEGSANLTLPIGTHSLDLQNFSNASEPFSLRAGETTYVNLSGAGEVTVNESGLPPGTPWGVTLNGTPEATSAMVLVLNVANGTYPLAYPPVSGYHLVGSGPATLTVPRTGRISLQFARFTYDVTFTQSGLPPSTPWWVDANGSDVQGTGPSLLVTAPNGSTPYSVGSLYEFLADPSEGQILVSVGIPTPQAVAFSYRATFVAGTVHPASAEVSIDGVDLALADGAFNASVIPGSYDLIARAPGYALDQVNVTATPGNVTWENLSLVANRTTGNGPGTPTAGGISLATAALVVAAVAGVAAATVIVLVRRRR